MNIESPTEAARPMLLSPGELHPLYGYPPYSSSKKNVTTTRNWRRASATVSEEVVDVNAVPEKTLIEEWVEQLIRIELGNALDADVKLKISLPADVIWTIQAALELRAKES